MNELQIDLNFIKQWTYKYSKLQNPRKSELKKLKNSLLLEDVSVLSFFNGLNETNLKKLAEIANAKLGLVFSIANNLHQIEVQAENPNNSCNLTCNSNDEIELNELDDDLIEVDDT